MRRLRARRTFGATDTIGVEFSIGDRAMGEEISVTGVPRLRVKLIGTDVLSRVDVIKNNRFVYTHSPGERPQAGSLRHTTELAFTFEDRELKPGESCYYYVRAIQRDNEIAWSSPIWVSRRG